MANQAVFEADTVLQEGWETVQRQEEREKIKLNCPPGENER